MAISHPASGIDMTRLHMFCPQHLVDLHGFVELAALLCWSDPMLRNVGASCDLLSFQRGRLPVGAPCCCQLPYRTRAQAITHGKQRAVRCSAKKQQSSDGSPANVRGKEFSLI